MSQVRYQPLGPLLAGEGSRAFLGLKLEEGTAPVPVVLVWAPPEVARDPELYAQLQRETQHATVFDHPNIIRVHGLVNLESGLARVTEFADGESLRRVLEVRPRVPPAFAALIAADVAMGIHYAHMAGNDDGSPLIHGDLRPETVMVSFNGVCKVTGYGALGVAPRERNGRRLRNQQHYSAPEQLIGGREAVTVATDVFLLGLLLYECLSGRMPFQDAPDAEKAILNRTLPPLPSDVPRALDEVVHRATARRANERYSSALAFRDAVIEAIEGLPSAETFSEFLAQLFPPESDARATRRQMLEIGLADITRRATQAPASGEFPPAPVQAPPAPAPLSVLPAPLLAPPVPTAELARHVDVDIDDFQDEDADAVDSELERANASTTPGVARPLSEEDDEELSPPRRSRMPLIASALVAVLALGGFFLWNGQKDSTRAAPKATEAPATVPGSSEGAMALAAGDAGTPLASARPAEGDAGTPSAPASPEGAVVAASGQVPSEAPGKTEAALEKQAPITTKLKLVVLPPVEVSLDGKLLGRTPLTVPLPPGSHPLELRNPARGVQTTRTVTVKPKGITKQRIRLRKGSVVVRAPPRSRIFVNGRKARSKLSLYEGEHQLVVTSGSKRWEKPFQLAARQRLVIKVDFEKPQ
ncbi:MAG TPA: protein kinase [Myxococcaceae bacterium]|nr:protein kinase [Myxococcaceae bacterium]